MSKFWGAVQWQAVRCQKECFSAPKITYSRKWCQNGHIPAPKPPVSKKQKNQLFSWFFVRAKGLEPPRRKTLDPKSSAATNYATPAFRIGIAKVGIFFSIATSPAIFFSLTAALSKMFQIFCNFTKIKPWT